MLGGCFASKHGQNSSNVSAPCKESPRIPHATQTGDWQSRDYQSPSAVLQMLIGGLATKELLIIDSLIKEPPVPLTEDRGLAIMGLPILLCKYVN